MLAGQKNVQATNVALRLWLSPEMQVRELYRTRPEILFVGDLQPDANNQVELRLEQMERGKAYEFLFRCTVPRRTANQRFRIAKATLVYDLPKLNKQGETLEGNLVVEYTADEERARERSGEDRGHGQHAEDQADVAVGEPGRHDGADGQAEEVEELEGEVLHQLQSGSLR